MNWQERAEKAEDVLRSLASFVGAGGYNADKVDADMFEQKIRWGIGQIMERLEKAEAELARLREQEPVVSQFLDGGKWHPFISDDHMKNTIAAGAWEIRQLYAAPVPAVADKRVDELAMLIRRLVRRLNQELPHNDIGEAAMDYLARNGMGGEILRGWAAPAPSAPEEWKAQILAAFPLLDDEGLCQEKYHCEWAMQQDRKRLHALLQSAEVTK